MRARFAPHLTAQPGSVNLLAVKSPAIPRRFATLALLTLSGIAACGHDEWLHMGDPGTAQAGTGGTIDAGGTGGSVTGHAASGGQAGADAPVDTSSGGALADAAGDVDSGEVASLDASDAPTVAPDFSLIDVNPSSSTAGKAVSPRDYLGQISAWYFGHST